MRRRVTGVFAIILLAGAAMAQDIVLSKNEVRIPKGKSMTFEFGTVPQKDTTVLLDVLARLDSDGYGGSLYFMKIVLKDLTIRAKPGASPMMAASAVDQDVVNTGVPGAGPAKYAGKLLPGGGFSLTVPGMPAVAFGSLISYPNAGLNQLTAAAKPVAAQPGFTVTTKTSAKGGQVSATGPDYRLVRTVKFTPRKVEISDRFINLHPDAKLGLLIPVRHPAARLPLHPD